MKIWEFVRNTATRRGGGAAVQSWHSPRAQKNCD